MNDLEQLTGLTHNEESRLLKKAYETVFGGSWEPKTLEDLQMVRALRLCVRSGFRWGLCKHGADCAKVMNELGDQALELPEGFKTPYA
ncbi:MAG TPA: hypothetical protein PLB89_05055 [Flavobacteriales bacterium]|nr:hypothetical protein [Flavobacteriales bacterium]